MKPSQGTKKWRRRLKWLAAALLAVVALSAFAVKDYVRTLQSLRRIPGTNAYVMDYYVNYHIDEVRARGMDVGNVEDSLIRTLLPDFVAPIATRVKRTFIPQDVQTIDAAGHHCSTLAVRSESGEVFFGRNFDWWHDACLILRTHDRQGVNSISVLDLAYLNLNRPDLEKTSLVQRIPLLFAPYYLMDGMSRYGIAVSDMSAQAKPPVDPNKPDVIHSTLMRLILDQAKDADEAVKIVDEFNVHFVDAQVHLLVADSAGRFRVIEFIDGKKVVTRSDTSWQICTNHLLSGKSERENDEACPRYRLGSDRIEQLDRAVTYADARQTVKDMSNASTMWSSIYELTSGRVHVFYRAASNGEHVDSMSVIPRTKAAP